MPKLIERKDKRGKQGKVNYSLTIPLAVVRDMKWKKGDELQVSKIDDKTVQIIKLNV